MTDAAWISLAMADPRRLRPFTNDFEPDINKLISIQRRNEAGEVLNEDEFPETIWGSAERGARKFNSLPDLFYGYGFWVVSDRCAEAMRAFDLGSASLHPVKVLEKDKATPIGDHAWFCLNFANQKNAVLIEQSKKIGPCGPRWSARATAGDNDIAVCRQALVGPSIWIDPQLYTAFFLSDPLVRALKKAKCTSGFILKRCLVVN